MAKQDWVKVDGRWVRRSGPVQRKSARKSGGARQSVAAKTAALNWEHKPNSDMWRAKSPSTGETLMIVWDPEFETAFLTVLTDGGSRPIGEHDHMSVSNAKYDAGDLETSGELAHQLLSIGRSVSRSRRRPAKRKRKAARRRSRR